MLELLVILVLLPMLVLLVLLAKVLLVALVALVPVLVAFILEYWGLEFGSGVFEEVEGFIFRDHVG